MTVEEAMERAQLIFTETPMGPGVWERQQRAVAAALIRAQIEALRSPSTRQILIAECEAALAKLEAEGA